MESALALVLSSTASSSKNIIWPKTIIPNAVECICCFTPASFREGVRRSGGKFLYRGESWNTKDNGSFTTTTRKPLPRWANDRSNNDDMKVGQFVGGWILNPKPDLLLPDTYGDPRALDYFECLEEYLSAIPRSRFSSVTRPSRCPTFLAKPSYGHIGTSDPQQAAQWGNVVSIWPLGDEISYVWPKDRTEFYRPNMNVICDKFDNKLVLNHNLAYALQSKREVLFCSWFEESPAVVSIPTKSLAFLTVPRELDAELLQALQRVHYCL
jgi:hypothetical protein